MRTLLSDPLFWIWATLRWHWREVMVMTMVVWGILLAALLVVNLVT